jgi:hypothetical protein
LNYQNKEGPERIYNQVINYPVLWCRQVRTGDCKICENKN